MIDILLATYNGEKYISQQIYSIISQTYSDWRLIIHDDGSTDSTVEIIMKFVNMDSRIIFIDDKVKCGSPCSNFMHLLQFTTTEHIMFCDQDDIWLDNKIEVSIELFTKKYGNPVDRPVVLFVNSYIWAPNSGIQGVTTHRYTSEIREFVFWNGGIQGCASIFNKKSVCYLLQMDPKYLAMHDHALQLVCVCLGSVYFENLPLMLYREHPHQVTGKTPSSPFSGIKNIVKNSQISVVDIKHYDAIKYFFCKFSHVLDQEHYLIITEYLEMKNKNRFNKVYNVIRKRFSKNNSTLYLILKIIFRKYIN